ncbi:peptidoglycan editing factor PgeF [Dendrosporobacter sp. 1207_IL3150]|uniref:peptidoglycan editing factor PgeF n=1 Tax=Dendrosporobacter sp. 1207_IL3150 TaxID=3084054 RepID=UPI002FD9CC7E
MGFCLKHANNGVWYGCFSHFDKTLITHAVSTRIGGISKAPFSTLNLGLHTGDDIESVCNNRRIFCEALGIDFDSIVTAEQIHGSDVAQVFTTELGKGAKDYSEALKGVDALITNISNLPLMLFFADCVPVLLFDPINKAIGVVHAGWKGTVAKISQKTVLSMREKFGTNPGDCIVGIAPSIGPCCYEVDEYVANQFKIQFDRGDEILTPHNSKWKLNLWAANLMQLEEVGVLKENIKISGVCTSCNKELFFSYRAENGRTGRMGAVISLK